MSDARAQAAETWLQQSIRAELLSAQAEAPTFAPRQPVGAPRTSFDSYAIVYPLCISDGAAAYYEAFGEQHGLNGPIDIERLTREIYAARNPYGFWQESRWPGPDSVGYDIVARAGLDWAIGTWLGERYLMSAEPVASVDTAAAALVFRTWCRVRVSNESVLSRFIAANGFPSQSQYGEQVESTSLFIFKHTRETSPLFRQYERAARQAHARGDLNDHNYAFLLDTVAVVRGRRQPVGSYFGCVDGRIVFDPPLRDRREAERLRRRYGLPTIEADLAAQPSCEAGAPSQ